MFINISGNKSTKTLEQRVIFVLKKISEYLNKKNFFLEVNIVGDEVINTNVKSYPPPADFPHPESVEKYLGEIYLNPDYIEKHQENFDHMLIHGFLHLLGYDHKLNPDAHQMEALEKELLRKIEL